MTTQTPNAPALPVVERLRVRARLVAQEPSGRVDTLSTDAADTILALYEALEGLLQIRSGRTVKAAKDALALARTGEAK